MNDIFGNMKESMERFFGTPAFKLARREDPVTSHQAAQLVDSTKLEKMVYEAIKGFPDGCISDEILAMYPSIHHPSPPPALPSRRPPAPPSDFLL